MRKTLLEGLPHSMMEECLEEGLEGGKEMYLSLPHIVRGEAPEHFWESAEEWLEKGMKGFLVRNLESYAMLKERGLSGRCVCDHSLYTWNNEAVDFWKKYGNSEFGSFEEIILTDTGKLYVTEGVADIFDTGLEVTVVNR